MADGTTTITTVDVIQAVRESAMLADISISMWSATKTDQDATERVKADAGATGQVGRFVKNLMAGADGKLKEVRSAFNQARLTHYNLTLPWVSDPTAVRQGGPRLLPHMLFDRYIVAMSKQKREASNQLDEFIRDYPVLVQQARANLGGLADQDYPSADEVRALFRINFDFEPLPAAAQFKGLPDHTIERLAAALHNKQQRMIETAQEAMWREAKERVGHIVERLSDPDAKFKVSTIENVRELLTLMPGWNLVGSSEVDEVVSDIKTMLDGVDAKTIRDNIHSRNEVAGRAKKLVDKMQAWGL